MFSPDSTPANRGLPVLGLVGNQTTFRVAVGILLRALKWCAANMCNMILMVITWDFPVVLGAAVLAKPRGNRSEPRKEDAELDSGVA